MITKAQAVLNKYFSSKMDMFKNAVQAQVAHWENVGYGCTHNT